MKSMQGKQRKQRQEGSEHHSILAWPAAPHLLHGAQWVVQQGPLVIVNLKLDPERREWRQDVAAKGTRVGNFALC